MSEAVSRFISEARHELELVQLVCESGKVLYSSVSTLRPGALYLLGLNPGGSPERERTIGDSLRDLEQGKDWNDYSHEKWYPFKVAGRHRLQRNVIGLFNALDLDLESVCASNLVFRRSPSKDGIKLPTDADRCWKVHEMIFSIVEPRTILAFGNSEESTFAYLTTKFPLTLPPREGPRPSRSARLWVFEGLRAGQAIKVVGLPHLSWNAVHKNSEVLNWIREQIAAPNLPIKRTADAAAYRR
jgi:hypothetical protein